MMRIFRLITFLSVVVSFTSGYQGHKQSANLAVMVVDPFGTPIKQYEVDLLDVTRTLISSLHGTETFHDVPFGEYYVVARIGCCRAERLIAVNTSNLFIRIAVPVRFGDTVLPGGDLNIEGLVLPKSKLTKDMWVRIRGVFLDFSREQRLDSEGRYSIRGLDMGSYTCELFKGQTMVFSQRLDLDPKDPKVRVRIDLDRSKND